jgi:hypothetical protein
MKTAKTGAFLATAVGLMLMANVALAQENGTTGSGTSPNVQTANVKCMGANSCKGNSSCKTAQNDCKGQNGCKGKGFVTTSSSQECTQKGGTPVNS